MIKYFSFVLQFILLFSINIVADTICIDPGHGGDNEINPTYNGTGTPGYNGEQDPYEKHVTLEFGTRLETDLLFFYWINDIYITRNGDYKVTISDRCSIANGNLPDANGNTAIGGTDEFLSIHCDGIIDTTVHGTSCLIWASSNTNTPPTNTERYAFALEVITQYIDYTDDVYPNARIINGDADGIKGRSDLGVLSGTNMPAVLIEMEFLTSNEAWYYLTDWYFYGDYTYVNAATYGMAVACDNYSPIINTINDEELVQEITGFQLIENYPNPFNPNTTIKYNIENASTVELEIFNTTGQLIKTINKGYKFPGSYYAVWDGTNNHGNSAASGTYICRLRAGDYQKSIKLSLLR